MSKLQFETIADVRSFMNQIPMFGSRGISAANFSLDTIKRFCKEIGNPQNGFKSVHVSGTNGKGTVCRMLASVYMSAGYKTGLYTSPHLIDLKERFLVDGKQITDQELLQFFRDYGSKVQEFELTYFEITTAIAFWFFNQREVDIAVIETGLGGRLDATNIITPMVSVITSIGKDHVDILGDTLEKIASEKAGIIKEGIPVVTGDLPAEANTVILNKTKQTGSDLHRYSEVNPKRSENKLSLLNGRLVIDSQNRPIIDTVNCAVAYKTIQTTNETLPVKDAEFVEGIEKMDNRFPLHAHFVKLHPEWNWYFDGSHNPDALRTLISQMKEISPLNNWTLVLSMMKDKLNDEVSAILKPVGTIQLYPLDTERSAAVNELIKYFPDGTLLKVTDSLPAEWIRKHKSELVIFSGSFYFYSTVRRWMGAIAATK